MVTNLENLCKNLREERKEKKIILFVGTFDGTLNRYLRYLKNAKQLGGILVVALVHKKDVEYKGKKYINGYQRANVVETLDPVDYVINVEYDPRIIQKAKEKNSIQNDWFVVFQDVINAIQPNYLYCEIPRTMDVRERVFEKYHFS